MPWEKEIKQSAKKLRGRGLTYPEIRKKLGKDVPQSTLSNWCHKVKLPSFYQEKIKKIVLKNQIKARKLAVLANRKRREHFLEKIRRKNKNFLKDTDEKTLKLLLGILYLAEGAKHPSTRSLKFASSDPEIIKFFLRSLKKCFKLNDSKFRVEIICRADQNLNDLKAYWQKITKINEALFYKPRIDKRTIGKKTKKKDYKGVCVIVYFDASIQIELQSLGRLIVQKL